MYSFVWRRVAHLIHMLHASLPFYLFSIYVLSGSQIITSPHLALTFPVRHTIFGITPLCWTEPESLLHPLLSFLQSWFYLPNTPLIPLFHKQFKLKGGTQRCQLASQATRQPACQPNMALFLCLCVKAHLLEAALDAISNSILFLNLPESF